jgi:hypothetical protein
MVDRKINVMHKRFSVSWQHTCKECRHLISGEWNGKRYHKCELYGMSHSEATDWRLSWIACGVFDADIDMSIWIPIHRGLKRSAPSEPPLDGQMRIDDYLNEMGVNV